MRLLDLSISSPVGARRVELEKAQELALEGGDAHVEVIDVEVSTTSGIRLVASDGGIFCFGNAQFMMLSS